MNNVGKVITAAFLGMAVASVLAVWRQKQPTIKAQDTEDIHRWEDEGGQALARRQGESASTGQTAPF